MAARKDRRKGWLVDFMFQHADGRMERMRKRSPVQSKRGAQDYERQLRQEMLNPRPKGKEVPTLETYASEFMELHASVHNKPSEVHSKRSILRRYLLPRFGRRRLNAIDARSIRRFQAWMREQGLSPKTTNNAVAVLTRILRQGLEDGLLESVPSVPKLKVPPLPPRFLSFEDAERLIETSQAEPLMHAMILTALRTGLRYGELCELRWKDVDVARQRISVVRSYDRRTDTVSSPKSGRSRVVPLSDQALAALLPFASGPEALVFRRGDGRRVDNRGADKALRRLCRATGVKPVGWHVLRHTFASHLVMRGHGLKVVQQLLGHSTMDMTLRYAHLAPELIDDAVKTLDGEGPAWSKVRATFHGTILAPREDRGANLVN